mmetsp:Transcript_34328/g.51807  ORF Transcript_34328/g.51807 Transcript_34328/m.51807 type:complete len:100 (+) Transcript_34328:683-982(+)
MLSISRLGKFCSKGEQSKKEDLAVLLKILHSSVVSTNRTDKNRMDFFPKRGDVERSSSMKLVSPSEQIPIPNPSTSKTSAVSSEATSRQRFQENTCLSW